MVERIDVSVRYNLEKTRSDSDIVTISVPMISTQQSVDVWKLDIATTAECCRSTVLLQSLSTADAREYTHCKNFLDDGEGRRAARL